MCHDLHLDVLYSQARLPNRATLAAPEGLARYRKAMEQANCTFEPVDKPVYVLTSAKTFSGAEHFSYELKMLKRATLVGRAAHAHRIGDHFGMGIPETRAINPFSKAD